LLELLWRLRQSIELARVDATGYEIVTSTLRSAFH